MKTITLLLAVLVLGGCSDKTETVPPLSFEGAATNYHEGHNPMFHGVDFIESSLITDGDKVTVYFNNDLAGIGTFGRVDLDSSVTTSAIYGDGMWYSYVLRYSNSLYMFYNNSQTGSGSVYLKVSMDDGLTWSQCNSGQPVVTNEAPDYKVLWNVGVDVDDQGTWHMLIDAEKSTAIPDLNLRYLTATMGPNCTISFDPSKPNAQPLPMTGAPFVKFIPGKGMMSILQIVDASGYWIISAAILKNGVWVVDDKFKIGAPSIHVCDPSATDLPGGGSIITMSFNQDALYGVYSGESLSQLYDQVENEIQ